jgi:carotenoid cleavage dioxygenase-like enzyme
MSLLLWLRPYIENFRWKPGRGTRFHVIERSTGRAVGSYDAESFFSFHHVNAFEDGDDLVVDLVGYDDASIIDAFYVNRLEDSSNELPLGTLRRFRLPVSGEQRPVQAETLSPTCIELPSFDYSRMNMSADHRYVYGVGLHDRQGFYDQLVKIDLRDGSARTWHEPGQYPGEGVFAGRPGRTDEDDGVVLSVVLDAARGTSYLLALDAHSLTEVARAELPHPVLFGYHGQFYDT